MRTKQYSKTLRLCVVAMMAAMAYVAMVFLKIPVVLFLSYEPKDVLLSLIALLVDPVAGILATAAVAFLEMITVSSTGLWGFLMNLLSSCAFLLPAALLCRRKKTAGRLAFGVLCGVAVMTATMLLWNFLVVPLYMGTSRAEVLPLLWSAFLPFNLIKGTANAVLVWVLFKPAQAAFKAAKLTPTDG